MKNHQAPAVILAIATIHKSVAYISIQKIPTTFCRRSNNNIGSSSKCISHAQHPYRRSTKQRRQKLIPLFSDPSSDNEDIEYDPNRWLSSDEQSALGDASWEGSLADREDGSLWSSFASSEDDDKNDDDDDSDKIIPDDDDQDIDDGELWLDTLASIAADEVEFNIREADRADKVRQMQELGFSSDSISSTLGVAVDTEQEDDESNEIFEAFKEETAKTGFGLMVDDEVDLQTVESHTQVEWDEEAEEPVRAQHVYVDEVTCIGCTNCAMIAQSTFFMEGEHGRARVFQQWGGKRYFVVCFVQYFVYIMFVYICINMHSHASYNCLTIKQR